jgi:hypothetical protein
LASYGLDCGPAIALFPPRNHHHNPRRGETATQQETKKRATWIAVAVVRSSSDPKHHYKIAMDRNGQLGCSCKGWIFGPRASDGSRTCKHLHANRDVLNELAARALENEMWAHVERQQAVIDDLAARETKRLPRAVQLELLL